MLSCQQTKTQNPLKAIAQNHIQSQMGVSKTNQLSYGHAGKWMSSTLGPTLGPTLGNIY